MTRKSATQFSDRIHAVISLVHRAFMQPKKSKASPSLRKQYWLEAWAEIKTLSPQQLEELVNGLETIRQTLRKLKQKVEELHDKRLLEQENRHLANFNELEEDEFLNSSSTLPVFNPKRKKKKKGKRWVMARPMEKPKTLIQSCQAAWVVITNRAIYIVDGGKKDASPSASRDLLIEKNRLAVLPNFLDDKTITDPTTGKPLMNLYMINHEIKETLLWLLAERAKTEAVFCKLFVKFLKKEVIAKEKMYEWAKKFTPQAREILKQLN